MDVYKDHSGEMIGKYHLIEKLGKGFFGVVYSVEDCILHSKKAIKIMSVTNPNHAQALFEEAAIPYKCRHNNIVQINGGSIEMFDNEPHFVIDMELVSGGSLEDLIRSGRLSIADTLKYIRDTLFALQHSHTQNIVHRDIKPANILISNGIAKLTDFGLASSLNQTLPTDEKWYKTHTAPEIKHTFTPTAQTDVFAIGVTMYRAANGVSNWLTHLQNIPKIDKLYDNGTFIEKGQFAPYIPNKVIRIIKKACRADPSKRYASASEMRDDIEKLKIIMSWIKESDSVWLGTSKKEIRRVEIISKRNSYNVDIKINGRKNGKESSVFASLAEAQNYLYTYIANNTVQ